jgi:hypothetical protein
MITASLQERSEAIAYPGLFATPTAIPPFKRVIEKFGLSAGRITQLRQRWCQDWLCFQTDADDR